MSPRAIVVAVVLLVVVFVVGIGLGARGDGQRFSSAEDFANRFSPSGLLEALGSLLRPVSPKLELRPSTFSVSPASPRTIDVPRSDEPLRIATFTLRQGAKATITYTPASPPGGLNIRPLELPRQKRNADDDPREGSLVIFRDGGKLQVSCAGNAVCIVALE